MEAKGNAGNFKPLEEFVLTLPHKMFGVSTYIVNIRASKRWNCVRTVMDWCNIAMVSPKFKKAESEASNHAFRKCSFSQCDDSCVETDIRLMLVRCIICKCHWRLKASHTLCLSQNPPVLVNATKGKLSTVRDDSNTSWTTFVVTALLNQCAWLIHTNKKGEYPQCFQYSSGIFRTPHAL